MGGRPSGRTPPAREPDPCGAGRHDRRTHARDDVLQVGLEIATGPTVRESTAPPRD
ncbi:hypothetical protein ACFUIY_37745 [Streptomyces griseorubiginosus]|uniref:hypothetical protein n=1 Tax=Streptomyces griseorubiginosus TaxID=67304 RepID=UPI0015E83FA4|nr:hypothetical protein [Streptomyces griseorubiginosus]